MSKELKASIYSGQGERPSMSRRQFIVATVEGATFLTLLGAFGGLLRMPGLGARESAPAKLTTSELEVLKEKFGSQSEVSTLEDLLSKVQECDLVCIGETHYRADEILFQKLIIDYLTQSGPNNNVAIGSERLILKMEGKLKKIFAIPDLNQRAVELEILLGHGYYDKNFGPNTWFYTTEKEFKDLLIESALRGARIFPLDTKIKAETLDDAADAFSPAKRNPIWADQVIEQLDSRPDSKIVALGGLTHFKTNDQNSPFFRIINSRFPNLRAVSIAQGWYPVTFSEDFYRRLENPNGEIVVVKNPIADAGPNKYVFDYIVIPKVFVSEAANSRNS